MKHKFYRISEITNNHGIHFMGTYTSKMSHCPMHTALSLCRRMKDLSSLVVGMPECSFYSGYVTDDINTAEDVCHYSYVLDSNEVVFGCREGVKEALEQMQKDHARYVLLIMTCIPALIGEDLQQLAEEFSKENTMQVTVVDMSHYKRNGYLSGYFLGLRSLICLLPNPKNQENIQSNKVMLLGASQKEESCELLQWIKQNKYEADFVGESLAWDQIKAMTTSKLNIVLDMQYLLLAQEIYAKFAIPYISIADAFFAEEIKHGYESIQNLLQIEEIFLPKQYEKLRILEQQEKHTWEGKEIVLLYPNMEAISLCNYLAGFGVKVNAMHLEEYQDFMKEEKAKLLASKMDPIVFYQATKDIENELKEQEITYDKLIGQHQMKTMQFLEQGGYQRSIEWISYFKEEMKHATI